MPRSLNFSLDGQTVSAAIEKVDRKKVYGWVDTKAFDREGNECYFGSLSADGIAVFGKESFEMGYIDENGEWVERAETKAVNEEGDVLEKVDASFKQEIELDDTVSIDDYLLHAVKSVYYFTGDGVDALLRRVELADGIISFPFNYTASYSPDPAFLIENEGELFMVVGTKPDLEFIGLAQQDDLISEDEAAEEEGEEDAFDFGMM